VFVRWSDGTESQALAWYAQARGRRDLDSDPLDLGLDAVDLARRQ